MASVAQKSISKSVMYLRELTDHISTIGKNRLPVNYYSGTKNFGDLLNIDIVEKILPSRVVKSNGRFRRHLLGIGSVLELANHRSTIWGSGFMFQDTVLSERPDEVLAVRGELSLAKLEKNFGETLSIPLGDPGFLYPDLFGINADITSDVTGVVPHYADLQHETLKELDPRQYSIIDPRRSPIEVVEDMAKCSRIISSSLHGCILGDALGLSVSRVKFSGKSNLGEFKYLDYESTLSGANGYSVVESTSDIYSAENSATVRKSSVNTNRLINVLREKYYG